ncbi:hypothetical protein AB0F72_22195 [Actinoplanes sp. NPDC023936]|uniref:hypothetical protein n=1 Tax=Actinoplanes sp. NPDC023936 TaxID=3154910 RepID=UPI0033D9B6A6
MPADPAMTSAADDLSQRCRRCGAGPGQRCVNLFTDAIKDQPCWSRRPPIGDDDELPTRLIASPADSPRP